MSNIRRIYSYIRPYWGKVFLAFICMGLFAVFNTIQFWIFKVIVDNNFIAKDLETLPYIISFALIIFLLKGISQYAQVYLMSYVGQRTIMDIRDNIYSHLHTLSLEFYAKRRTGDLMSHLLNDITIIQNTIIVLFTDIIRQPMVLMGLTGYIFYLHWKLAVLCVVVYPLAIYPIVKYSKRLRKINVKVQEKMSDITALLQEVFSGITIVKAFSMEDYEVKKFKQEDRSYFNTIMKTIRITAILPSLMEFVGSIGFSLAVYYGVHEIVKGNLTPGDFISFVAAVISFYRPVRSLTQVNNNIQQAEAASSRIFSILDVKPKITEKTGAIEIQDIKDSIKFERVYFSYENKENVLKDINLNVKTGMMIALVGPSGTGKTSLVNLLLRFYDPSKGKITFDGVDIRDVTIKSLREQIGMVTQETILFYDTVKNNIAYGKKSADMSQIEEAARKANAVDFIEKLPKKYETIIGERGIQLSGGQRQRLSIARAILKNPPILILDEATSALDTESERLVQAAIRNLMKNRTTFVIAHRLSTVVNADSIIVLDEGKISDIGRHEELLKKSSIYKRLYEMQFKEE